MARQRDRCRAFSRGVLPGRRGEGGGEGVGVVDATAEVTEGCPETGVSISNSLSGNLAGKRLRYTGEKGRATATPTFSVFEEREFR